MLLLIETDPRRYIRGRKERTMYAVYEVFDDGKRFLLFEHSDRFTCEVYVYNHQDATTALRNRWSRLVIEKR